MYEYFADTKIMVLLMLVFVLILLKLKNLSKSVLILCDKKDVTSAERTPNPTTGKVDVHWPISEGTGTLEMFNLNGIRVIQQKVDLMAGVQSLLLENQPQGIYLVRLNSVSGSLTHKLIIH